VPVLEAHVGIQREVGGEKLRTVRVHVGRDDGSAEPRRDETRQRQPAPELEYAASRECGFALFRHPAREHSRARPKHAEVRAERFEFAFPPDGNELRVQLIDAGEMRVQPVERAALGIKRPERRRRCAHEDRVLAGLDLEPPR
jgi:hypothetical protein